MIICFESCFGLVTLKKMTGINVMLNEHTSWHSQSESEVLNRLASQRSGLSDSMAQDRLQTYGANRLPVPHKTPAWLLFLRQFHNVLVYVLVVAGVIAGLLGIGLIPLSFWQ